MAKRIKCQACAGTGWRDRKLAKTCVVCMGHGWTPADAYDEDTGPCPVDAYLDAQKERREEER